MLSFDLTLKSCRDEVVGIFVGAGFSQLVSAVMAVVWRAAGNANGDHKISGNTTVLLRALAPILSSHAFLRARLPAESNERKQMNGKMKKSGLSTRHT